MASPHWSRRPASSDSGYSTTSEGSHSPLSDKRRDGRTQHTTTSSSKEQSQAANHETSLSTMSKRTDLTPFIGTELTGIQLSKLTSPQRDELALLVSERGVVFLRSQILSTEDQLGISSHYGSTHGQHIVEQMPGDFKLKNSPTNHGERCVRSSGCRYEWRSDRSFETNPSSYSIMRAAATIGHTVWVSQYGLYDSLSRHMRGFLDTLTAEHTSQGQYDSIVNLRGMPSHRSPVRNYHPAVRTHPITGLKALNVTPMAVTSFSELSEKESRGVLELLKEHLQSSDEETVRFRWEADSVAIWDNRCTAYKHLFGLDDQFSDITETISIGEKPYFDVRSESRSEKRDRVAREEAEIVIRAEEAMRRYNNTPLRRILSGQARGEQYLPSSTRQDMAQEDDSATRLLRKLLHVETSTNPANQASVTAETDRAVSLTIDYQSRMQQASLKGSPLRRIIQRQVSNDTKAR